MSGESLVSRHSPPRLNPQKSLILKIGKMAVLKAATQIKKKSQGRIRELKGTRLRKR